MLYDFNVDEFCMYAIILCYYRKLKAITELAHSVYVPISLYNVIP